MHTRTVANRNYAGFFKQTSTPTFLGTFSVYFLLSCLQRVFKQLIWYVTKWYLINYFRFNFSFSLYFLSFSLYQFAWVSATWIYVGIDSRGRCLIRIQIFRKINRRRFTGPGSVFALFSITPSIYVGDDRGKRSPVNNLFYPLLQNVPFWQPSLPFILIGTYFFSWMKPTIIFQCYSKRRIFKILKKKPSWCW